ncbi:Hint domain-containing protein [Actibacterium sp. XHP0104]|uniref:Hint domain-containing protein n=1 Tax=Actibacterium sp. XHP0104 TaxID=2984335 RepID=UPI0021E945F4|nr:Hint domain-containing protein [Actibacterium sp. XHP0104]MCV2880629.1 Hint domain-containing protein [Actibacterium sp. XHP0104]
MPSRNGNGNGPGSGNPVGNGGGNGGNNNATTYTDTFYLLDPMAPPAPGSTLTAITLTLSDHRSDNLFGLQGQDKIDGVDIRSTYVGDTITVEYPDGSTQTITGVTFYLADGRELFTPIDGTDLTDAVLVSTSYSTTTDKVTTQQLGITCFTPGVRIRTPSGTCEIEKLQVGDLVVTKDRGARPVRWIGKRTIDASGDHAPICFAKGAIGNRRELLVSPQHRMLVRDWRAQVYFGQREMLIAAKHLINDTTITRSPRDSITYIHLLFDQHEIIYAEGVATESFHPGDYILDTDAGIRAELQALFPELSQDKGGVFPVARPVLRGADSQLFA